MRQFLIFLAVVLALGLMISCAYKEPPVEPPPAVEEPVPEPVPEVVKPEVVKPVEQPAPKEEIPSDIVELNKKGYLKDVFFNFDKYDLTGEARDILAANAVWLRKYSTVKVVIEGHCDERGTREYNLSLGENRASTARDYLISLGVDSAQIDVISYGEDRSFETCHADSCWSQNRRGHFLITAR